MPLNDQCVGFAIPQSLTIEDYVFQVMSTNDGSIHTVHDPQGRFGDPVTISNNWSVDLAKFHPSLKATSRYKVRAWYVEKPEQWSPWLRLNFVREDSNE